MGKIIYLSAIFLVFLSFTKNVAAGVIFSEILPNPEGEDQNQEWIELYNANENPIDLSNWKIVGKKIFEIPENTKISEKSWLTIENINFQLKNSDNEIKLLNEKNILKDIVRYDKSTEGESFTKTLIKSAKQDRLVWLWGPPTKGEKNKVLYELQGKITSGPEIEKNYFFKIQDKNKKESKIIFSEKTYDFNLLKSLLYEDMRIKILAERINLNSYNLKNFEIEPEIKEKNKNEKTSGNWEYFLLIPVSLLLSALICLAYQKKSN